jgi:uncharacterized protein (DUF1697 family)
MQALVILLRAVNVGGTGKLAMRDLVRLCEEVGLEGATTYIQSGNVVVRSDASEAEVKARLEPVLERHVGKPIGVLVRTAKELEGALARNPFRSAPPNRVLVLFLDEAPPKDAIAHVKTPGGEELVLDGRELFLHFPNGQGASKLKIPFGDVGTARNLNTLNKMVAMVSAFE